MVTCDVVPPGPINIVYSKYMTIKINNIQLEYKGRVNDLMDAKTALINFKKYQIGK